MKLPTLSRLWKVLRNAVAVVCGLVIVVALLPSKARSQLGLDPCCAMMSVGLNTISGLLRNCRGSAARFHSAEPTAVRKLRAAGGVSHGCD